VIADLFALHGALRAIIEVDRDAVQDALDIAAVAAAVKPAALFGLAGETPARIEALTRVALHAGLSVATGRAWVVAGETDGLPSWYAEAIDAQRSKIAITVIGAPAPCARLTSDDEAALLGYPRCCTAAQRARANLLHGLRARRIAALTDDDDARRRLALNGVEFLPRDDVDARELAQALDVTIAPFTAMALCGTCARDGASPGIAFSRRMAELASLTSLTARAA
jgi:hypothetical protein